VDKIISSAVPNLIRLKALTTSHGEVAWCHSSRTLRLKALFAGALVIWTRWDATVFAETGRPAD